MNNCLLTTDVAADLIRSGAHLLLAGTESALDALPKGSWIAGTIPYFMAKDGGLKDTTRVFATQLPAEAYDVKVVAYDAETIHQVAVDGPEHGFTVLIVPAFSHVHTVFAENAPEFPEMFLKPIVGWVSGVEVEQIGKVAPRVYLGDTGQKPNDMAAAMHVALQSEANARIDIVNLFQPGSGPVLQFAETAFGARECKLDGRTVNLAKYIAENKIDTRLPLVANFCGAIINTSIAAHDAVKGEVRFFAPVFPGVEYRFAGALGDYAQEFDRHVPRGVHMAFSCNCILNYVYGELEGKALAGTAGPITFGEIAYQLLNQTMVYLEIVGRT